MKFFSSAVTQKAQVEKAEGEVRRELCDKAETDIKAMLAEEGLSPEEIAELDGLSSKEMEAMLKGVDFEAPSSGSSFGSSSVWTQDEKYFLYNEKEAN